MPSELVFVDTNILIYAHDSGAGARHAIAQQRIRGLLMASVLPVISTQVLQELYVNLKRRKASAGVKEIVSAYLGWQVVPSDGVLVMEGVALAERYQISLWDSLIIAAAHRAGAGIVWSEDLNDGQDYGGVRVVNPLR